MCSFRGFDGHNCSNNNDLIWFYLLVLSKEDGKLMADAETGEFWSFFGGFAPLPRKAATDDDKPTESSPGKLLWYFFFPYEFIFGTAHLDFPSNFFIKEIFS